MLIFNWIGIVLRKRVSFDSKNLIVRSILLCLFIWGITQLSNRGTSIQITSIILHDNNQILFNIIFYFLTIIIFLITSYSLLLCRHLKNITRYKFIQYIPIKYSIIYTAEIIDSALDIWPFLISIILFVIFSGLSLTSNFMLSIFTIILLFSYLLFICVFNQFVRHWLDHSMKCIREKWILTTVLISMLLIILIIIFSPIQILEVRPNNFDYTLIKIFYYIRLYLTPIGLIADGFINILHENYLEVLVQNLPFIIGHIIFFFIIGCHLSKKNLHNTSVHFINNRSRNSLLLTLDNVFHPISNKLGTIFSKEIICLLRSNRIIFSFLLMSLFILIHIVKFCSLEKYDDTYLIIVLSLPALFTSIDSGYPLLSERKAIKFHFFNPLSFIRIIIAKNSSYFLLILISQLYCYSLTFIILKSKINFPIIIHAFVLSFYITLILIMSNNYSAITKPKRIEFNSIFTRSTSILISTLTLCFLIIPLIFCYTYFYHSYEVMIVISIILLPITAISYFLIIKHISQKLLENRDNFIRILSG